MFPWRFQRRRYYRPRPLLLVRDIHFLRPTSNQAKNRLGSWQEEIDHKSRWTPAGDYGIWPTTPLHWPRRARNNARWKPTAGHRTSGRFSISHADLSFGQG